MDWNDFQMWREGRNGPHIPARIRGSSIDFVLIDEVSMFLDMPDKWTKYVKRMGKHGLE